MDRLEMAIELIKEAQRERKNIAQFEVEINDAQTWEERQKVYDRFGRIPKKSRVNDNIKMARRLLADGYIK